MPKEKKKDEGVEMERREKRREGKVKERDRERAPGHKATKRKASLLFD